MNLVSSTLTHMLTRISTFCEPDYAANANDGWERKMSLNNKSVYFSLNPNWVKVCGLVQSETNQNMVICNRTIRLSCHRRL